MSVYLPNAKSTTYIYAFQWKGKLYKDTTHQTVKAEAELVEAKKKLEVGAHRPFKVARKTVVYFIRCDDAIKIGVASNVVRRLAALQTTHPDLLALLATIEGGFRLEGALHARFAHLRIRGEWFAAGPDLLAFIAREAQP